MADPTDRQRAEAKARELASKIAPTPEWDKWIDEKTSIIADALLSFRREALEEAAKAVDDGWSTCAAIIRALKPKE